jgi:hypothetical protein
MIVFSRGMFIGLNGKMDAGGHVCPISMFGEILLWKNAQKKEKKNSTSDVMNRIIPICRPLVTIARWLPCAAVSDETLVHHMALITSIVNRASWIGIIWSVFTQRRIDVTRNSALFLARTGHGLFSTMWKW